MVLDGGSNPGAVSIDPRQMRRIIVSESRRANVGHIGSCLCVVEILAALYGNVLRAAGPDDPDRDRFVLSKGHAALALYAALALKGWISEADLGTFCGDNSYLGVHPEAALRGVDFSTRSLGHGLGFAVGAALGARMQGSSRRAFCLLSDGECNEGSVWEAAAFAAHHRLSRLTAVLDWNGQQAFGRTLDVLDYSNLRQRWDAFGWRVTEVDGHNLEELIRAFSSQGPKGDGQPHLVLARTTFGKGVSFMERGLPITRSHLKTNPINWHYLPMSDEEHGIARAELEGAL
jgi:transketolase